MPLRVLKTKVKNKFEDRIYKQLRRAKVSFSYETEKIPFLIAGHYCPDFVLVTPTGKIYIETKGYFRPDAKRKMVAVKKLNPHLDIRIIFYSERKDYIKWATKNGFRWAIQKVPKEWMKGL